MSSNVASPPATDDIGYLSVHGFIAQHKTVLSEKGPLEVKRNASQRSASRTFGSYRNLNILLLHLENLKGVSPPHADTDFSGDISRRFAPRMRRRRRLGQPVAAKLTALWPKHVYMGDVDQQQQEKDWLLTTDERHKIFEMVPMDHVMVLIGASTRLKRPCGPIFVTSVSAAKRRAVREGTDLRSLRGGEVWAQHSLTPASKRCLSKYQLPTLGVLRHLVERW